MASPNTERLRQEPLHSKGGRWNLPKMKAGVKFRCLSGDGIYAKHESGAVVRVDKDRHSVKERKAARRLAREQKEH